MKICTAESAAVGLDYLRNLSVGLMTYLTEKAISKTIASFFFQFIVILLCCMLSSARLLILLLFELQMNNYAHTI